MMSLDANQHLVVICRIKKKNVIKHYHIPGALINGIQSSVIFWCFIVMFINTCLGAG